MRSIGKIKIRKLKAICKGKISQYAPLSMNSYQCAEDIKANIPEEWFDTWEGAWSEIQRLIDDEISNFQYKR